MSVTLRPARQSDIPALARIAAASYRHAFLPIIGEAGLALRGAAFFEARFAAEWMFIHLAADGAQALGFAEVRGAMLDMLFVDPARIGGGVGAALLADAERRGARRLECFTENHAARRFYARHGWREIAHDAREFAGAAHRFVAMVKP